MAGRTTLLVVVIHGVLPLAVLVLGGVSGPTDFLAWAWSGSGLHAFTTALVEEVERAVEELGGECGGNARREACKPCGHAG